MYFLSLITGIIYTISSLQNIQATVVSTRCQSVFRSEVSSNQSLHIRRESRNEKIAHEAITTDLYNGITIQGRPFSENNNFNAIFEVKVFNPQTGRSRVALFKPRTQGDGNGWNRVPLEYAAYEIGRLLNTDVIPPAAYRKNFSVGEYTFREGALLFKVPDTHPLRTVAREKWDLESPYAKIDKDLFLSDTRVIDVLLQNADRHIDNFMRGKHWVDGVYRPFLIDHAASLRPGTNIRLETNDAFNNGAVTVFRRSTYESLQSLNRDSLRNLKEFITETEISEILSRKNQILSYIHRLIEQNGYENVIF